MIFEGNRNELSLSLSDFLSHRQLCLATQFQSLELEQKEGLVELPGQLKTTYNPTRRFSRRDTGLG